MSQLDIDIPLSFHRAYARLRLRLDEDLGIYHGIDFDDFILLHWLARAEDGAASLATLAAELGASLSAILRRLRPLEKIGLLACDGGLRTRRIALRPAGLRLIHTAQDTVVNVYSKTAMIDDIAMLTRALPGSA